MTYWNLNTLRYTVRKLTGRYDITQLPDQSTGQISMTNPKGIDDYLNDAYLLDLPEEFRSLELRRFFTFTTLPNVGTYNVPQTYNQVYGPIYIDNYEFSFYQDPTTFYRIWPELNFIDQNLFTPDGSAGTAADPFTFTLSQVPVQQGTVVIGLIPNQDGNPSPQLETLTDVDYPGLLDQPTQMRFTNPGTLTGNLGSTGTVDYLTGVCTISYLTAPPNGTTSSCHYHPYVASRPRDIMLYQQQLFLRPIPNDTYSVKLMSYIQPTVAVSDLTNAVQKTQFDGVGTDVPMFNEWWQMIAYSAARKIFIEDGDFESAQIMMGFFDEQKCLAQRKALKQLAQQRIQTAYSDQQGAGPTWPVFPMY